MMSQSFRTTRRLQVEQLEARLTPSTLLAADGMASAIPIVTDIVLTTPTDLTHPSLDCEALAGDEAGKRVAINSGSNGGGNTAAPVKGFEIQVNAEQTTTIGSTTQGAGAGHTKFN
jgi:hypothetical protein